MPLLRVEEIEINLKNFLKNGIHPGSCPLYTKNLILWQLQMISLHPKGIRKNGGNEEADNS